MNEETCSIAELDTNNMKNDKVQWEGKTGGGQFGQLFLLRTLKHLNVRYLYPFIYLAIPFYLIFGKKGRNAAFQYFRKRQRNSRLKSIWNTFRNHIVFGEVVLDKFALLAGNVKQFIVEPSSNEHICKNLLSQEKGFIIASAHVGNLELSGFCLPHNSKRINTIIFGGERADFQKHRDNAFEKVDINLIPVRDDMSHLYEIKNALDNGEVVVIPCDRLFGSTKCVTCSLLNGSADLPIGPFRLAAQLEVPVVSLFIMKEKATHYKVYESLLNSYDDLPNSSAKATEMTKEYASVLGEIIKKYPTQWFNFFPFWNESDN